MNELIQTPPEIEAALNAQAANAEAARARLEAEGAVTRAEIEAGAAKLGLLGAGVESPVRFGDRVNIARQTDGSPISLEDATPAMVNHAVGAQTLRPSIR